MSFIDKYTEKPTKEGLKKMDSEVMAAMSSGALARNVDQIEILEKYVEEAKDVFSDSKNIKDLIDNISSNIGAFKEKLNLFRVSKDCVNNLAEVVKGVWVNYRAHYSNLPSDFDAYFDGLKDNEKMDLINDIYVKAIKGKENVNSLNEEYQKVLKENAA